MREQEKKIEQMASHDYWSVTAENSQDITPEPGPWLEAGPRTRVARARGERTAERLAPRTLQRVVTIPEADPSDAFQRFSQRRQQRQQSQRSGTRPQRRTHLVPRTLAQTGLPAASGRARTTRRSLPYQTVPIPARSSKNQTRRGLFWKLLGIFSVCVLSVLLGSFVLTSNAFRIAQVNVKGTGSDALVRSIQKMGMQGQNIFLLDITGLTRQIEALPRIAEVELSKQLPNGLTVNVTERLPVALWQTEQGTFGVDEQGQIIAPAGELTDKEHLPTIVDLTPRQKAGQPDEKQGRKEEAQEKATMPVLRPGMRLQESEVAFATDVMRRLPQVVSITTFKLYYDGTIDTDTTRTEEGGAGSRGSFIVEGPAGWKAYLGGPADPNPLDTRLIELREILALAEQEQLNVATIDLRYGLRPVFTIQE